MISTIREWFQSILGTYEPVTYTDKIIGTWAEGYTVESVKRVANGLAGVDWEYIFTALFLLVVIYSVFRLLGILLQAFTGGGRY